MLKRALSIVIILCLLATMVACSSNSNKSSQTNTASPIKEVSDTNQYYDTTFGDGKIIEVDVTLSEEDWNDTLENATEEEYHPASITVNGTTVDNVGFRTKGFSSLTSVANSDSTRYGFKVKFDEYEENQTLNGLDTLVLNASFSDASYMRELMTYSASAYLDGLTPYLSYCSLSINGELQGLYLCIEAYDDSFVERNTDAEDTVLYKAVSENCTLLTSDDATGFDVDYGEDEDFSNIKSLITVLNSTTEENKEDLEAILDIDSVLKAIAVNTVMGNYDSYSGSKAHNYYLLYSNGKFSYIGWDYNMSLGGFSEDNGASVTVDITEPVYNVDISERPLIQKLLAIEEYYDQYLEYIDQLTNYFSDFENTVAGIADLISDDVKTDPTAFYTFDQFETCITASDTDLTQVQNMSKKNGRKPDDMNRPDTMNEKKITDNKDTNSTKDKDSNTSYEDEDHTMPKMPDGTPPEKPDGTMPQQGQGNGMPNGKGGMINSESVSIVDYITQRMAQIEEQMK